MATTIQVKQALTDQSVETIDDFIEIHNMNDLYLVMNLPNLKKAKFDFLLYSEDDGIKDMYAEYLAYHEEMEETIAMWMLFIQPALSHYCRGIYMTEKGVARHNRSLDGTDFTFQWEKRSEEKISVRYVDSKITTKTYVEQHLTESSDSDVTTHYNESKKMFDTIEEFLD